MSRVSVLMFPEPGHILPTLRIAQRLHRAGHSLTYLTTVPFRAGLGEMGFAHQTIFSHEAITKQTAIETWPYETPLPAMDLWRDWGNRVGRATSIRELIRALALDELVPAVVKTKPDLLLCDSKIAAACGDIIERAVGVKIVALSTELPTGDATPWMELVLCPADLELPAVRHSGERRVYCEPSVWTERPSAAVRYDLNGKLLIYCSLGTQAKSYPLAASVLRDVVSAFANRPGVHVVVAAGALVDSPVLSLTAPNVQIVRSVDQLQVLSRASIAILHGGLGGIKECILCGVPMLLVPFVFDQWPNADRVMFHGLGRIRPPSECTADVIRQDVEQIIWGDNACEQLIGMQAVFSAIEVEAPTAKYIDESLASID